MIAEKNGKGVAAVHCGWRSLAAGILQKTIERLRERIGDPDAQFIAWVGPRIGDDDFETSSDVLEAMQTSIDGAEVAFKAKDDGKYLCSLTTLARMALLQVKVDEVVEARHSTYANPELFYSFRRDGKTGRHAAMIWIKG